MAYRILTVGCVLVGAGCVSEPHTVTVSTDDGNLSFDYSCSETELAALSGRPVHAVRGIALDQAAQHIIEAAPPSAHAALQEAVRAADGTRDIGALERAVVSYFCAAGRPTSRPPRSPETGSEAPNFVLERLVQPGSRPEAPVSLADLRGTPTVLVFWSTWCGPCRDEYPEMRLLARGAAEGGYTIFGILHKESTSSAQAWLRDHGDEVPMLVDADERVARAYQVYGIPRSFAIGVDGRLRVVSYGYQRGDLAKLVEAARGPGQ